MRWSALSQESRRDPSRQAEFVKRRRPRRRRSYQNSHLLAYIPRTWGMGNYGIPMSTEHPPTRLPTLDLLRFTAAVAVTLYHYVTCYPSSGDAPGTVVHAISTLARYGYLGVDLFFMISGFVVLLSSVNRTPLEFVVSRVSRLYPSFWVSIVLTVGCIALLGDAVRDYVQPPLDLRTLLANATMMPALLKTPLIESVYWTLEIEIRFYALIFLLLLTGQMKNVETWLYAWLALSIVSFFVELPWPIRYLALTPYGPFFIGGCLLYLAHSEGVTIGRGSGLILSATSCAYISLTQRSQFITPDRVSAAVVPLLTLSFFLLFAWLAMNSKNSRPSPATYWAGALTYPLYLTHATMGLLVYEVVRPKFGTDLAIATITALALLVAWIITIAIDIPVRKPFSNLLFRCAGSIGLKSIQVASESAG